MNVTSARISLALLCVAFLAGCGGGGDSKPAGSGDERGDAASEPKQVDACKLLDKAAVAEAIGEAVSKVDGQDTPDGASSCSWYGTDDGSLRQKGITVIAAGDNGKERWEAHRDLLDDPRPVSGIGDEAVTAAEAVAAYEGDAFVVTAPLYADTGVEQAKVEELTRQALDALA